MVREEKPYLSELELNLLSEIQLRTNRSCQDDGTIALSSETSALSPERVTFFRGFGRSNEIRYVLCDILKRHVPFGDVCLFYTEQAYESLISAELESCKIPCRMVSGRRVSNLDYIQLLLNILDWAAHDFELSYLQMVLNSPSLYIPYERDGRLSSMSGNSVAELCLRGKTGEGEYHANWGIRRYWEFIRRMRVGDWDQETEVRRASVAYLSDLLSVFRKKDIASIDGERISVLKLYERLLHHVDKYTRKNDRGRSLAAAFLERLPDYFRLIERGQTLDQAIFTIRERLLSGTVSEKDAPDAVRVMLMKNFQVLERKENYVIGLSQKAVQGRRNESALLWDREMEDALSGGYIPTREHETRRRYMDFCQSVWTLGDRSIHFGYPSLPLRCEQSFPWRQDRTEASGPVPG